MTTDSDIDNSVTLQPPKYLFAFIFFYAASLLFLERLIYVPTNGWEWFTTYTQEAVSGILVLKAFQMITITVWYLSAHYSENNYLPFWTLLISGTSFIMHNHGTVDYSSSSTASLVLLFIPVCAVGAIAIGWGLGYLLDRVLNKSWQSWVLVIL